MLRGFEVQNCPNATRHLVLRICDGKSFYTSRLDRFEAQNFPKAKKTVAFRMCDGQHVRNQCLERLEAHNPYTSWVQVDVSTSI